MSYRFQKVTLGVFLGWLIQACPLFSQTTNSATGACEPADGPLKTIQTFVDSTLKTQVDEQSSVILQESIKAADEYSNDLWRIRDNRQMKDEQRKLEIAERDKKQSIAVEKFVTHLKSLEKVDAKQAEAFLAELYQSIAPSTNTPGAYTTHGSRLSFASKVVSTLGPDYIPMVMNVRQRLFEANRRNPGISDSIFTDSLQALGEPGRKVIEQILLDPAQNLFPYSKSTAAEALATFVPDGYGSLMKGVESKDQATQFASLDGLARFVDKKLGNPELVEVRGRTSLDPTLFDGHRRVNQIYKAAEARGERPVVNILGREQKPYNVLTISSRPLGAFRGAIKDQMIDVVVTFANDPAKKKAALDEIVAKTKQVAADDPFFKDYFIDDLHRDPFKWVAPVEVEDKIKEAKKAILERLKAEGIAKG